jgi:hypothetical protein
LGPATLPRHLPCPVHIDDFPSVCCTYIDQVLADDNISLSPLPSPLSLFLPPLPSPSSPLSLPNRHRFWGQRLYELGISPAPVHIDDFPSVCCTYIDQVLAKDSVWALRAHEFAEELRKSFEEDPDGLLANVEAVVSLSEGLEPYNGAKGKKAAAALKKEKSARLASPDSVTRAGTTPIPRRKSLAVGGSQSEREMSPKRAGREDPDSTSDKK